MPRPQRDEFENDAPMVVPPIGSVPKPPPKPVTAAPPPAGKSPVGAAKPAPPPAPPQAPPIGTIAPMQSPAIGANAAAPGVGLANPVNAGAAFNRPPVSTRVAPDVPLQSNPNVVAEDRIRAGAEQTTGEQIQDLTPGAAEARPDFARPTGGGNAPSNFVSFSDFAGLNDDMMREIADRAAADSEQKRQGAASLLEAAKREVTATTPLEKTASYSKYLDAVNSANATALGATARTENPYEDALRGIYASSQSARENRLQTNALKRGANAAKFGNAEYAAAVKAAADKAAADQAAAKAAADKSAQDSRNEVAQAIADQRAERIGNKKGPSAGRQLNKYGD